MKGFGVFLDIKNMEYKNVDEDDKEEKDSVGVDVDDVKESGGSAINIATGTVIEYRVLPCYFEI